MSLGSKFTGVRFYTADWCSQCKMVKPQLAGKEYTLVDVDDDDGVEEADRMNVRGMPTLIKFENGVEVGRAVGNDMPKINALFEEG